MPFFQADEHEIKRIKQAKEERKLSHLKSWKEIAIYMWYCNPTNEERARIMEKAKKTLLDKGYVQNPNGKSFHDPKEMERYGMRFGDNGEMIVYDSNKFKLAMQTRVVDISSKAKDKKPEQEDLLKQAEEIFGT